MNNDRRIEEINNSIKYEEEKVRAYLLIAKVALAHCTNMKEKEKEKISALLSALSEAKLSKKQRVATNIQEKVKKLGRISCFDSSYEIFSELEEKAKKQRVKIQTELLEQYSSTISQNPTQAMNNAIREYISSKRRIEFLEERKKNPPKQTAKQEEKKTQVKQTYNQQERISYPYDPTDTLATRHYKTANYLVEKYTQLAHDKSTFWTKISLDSKDEKIIKSLFGEDERFVYYYVSLVEDIISNGYTIESTFHKFKEYEKQSKIPLIKPNITPKLEDLLLMAECIVTQLPTELTTLRTEPNSKNTFFQNLINKTELMNSLEKYNKAYEVYKKYFQKLSPEEQTAIKEKFEASSSTRYAHSLNIEKFEILHPIQLRELVNNKVIEKMTENNLYYGANNNFDRTRAIKKATTFMDREKTAQAYKAIKFKHERTLIYSTMNENDVKYHQQYFATLQENFAITLVNKLTEEEKKNKTEEELLLYVCETILNERPLFTISRQKTEVEATKENIEETTTTKLSEDGKQVYTYISGEETKTTTNAAIAARYNAQHRFFGLNKMLQTTNRIRGTWAKFEKLWREAAQVTDEKEIQQVADELNQMFRR